VSLIIACGTEQIVQWFGWQSTLLYTKTP